MLGRKGAGWPGGKTGAFAARAESKLVTDGLYARTRNPLYLAATILLLGWCVALRLTPLAFLSVIFFVHFLFVAKWEEKELQARFGQEYEDYRKRVPLLVPRLRTQATRRHPPREAQE